jgi:hypothetical protein
MNMAKPGATEKLREKIRLLEIRQAEEAKILKEQFKITYESLKPANLLKSTLKELAGPSELKNNLLETIVSILSGYLSNKVLVGKKGSIFKKLLGLLLQYGVTNLVANNAENIRNLFLDLLGKVLKSSKKSAEPET